MAEITEEICQKILGNETAYKLRHLWLVPLARAWLDHEAQVAAQQAEIDRLRHKLFIATRGRAS